MSTPAKSSYHHGDLRAALLVSAMGILENGETFSLRAVARQAGVSQAAPYRHFADREALESALAVQGFRDLMTDVLKGRELPASLGDLAEFGVSYVEFALRRPQLFRLMFGRGGDADNAARVQAAAELHELVAAALANVFPGRDLTALATANWALVHGLAFLHLDGTLAKVSSVEVAERVRASVLAIFDF